MPRHGWCAAIAIIAVSVLMPSNAAPDADVPLPSDDEEIIFLDEGLSTPASFLPTLGPRQMSTFIAIAQIVLAALMAIRSWSPLGQIGGAIVVYADAWLLLGGMPERAHSEHCRSLTGLVVAAAFGLALGAHVAAGMGIAVGGLFPQAWLLWPKRQRESEGGAGHQTRAAPAEVAGSGSLLRRKAVTVAILRQHGVDTARKITDALEEELGMPSPVKLSVQYHCGQPCLCLNL